MTDQPRVVDVLDTPEAGRRVVRGGALRVGGFVAGLGASLVAAIFVTRHLGPVDYGRYQLVVALATIVQLVTDFGMTALAIREYSQRHGADRDHFMRVLLGMRLASTVIGVTAATLAAILLGYDRAMVIGTVLVGVGVGVSVVAGTIAIPLAANIRMGVVTGLDVARQVLTAIAFVALVALGSGIVPFLAITIPVHFVILVATLMFVRDSTILRPIIDARSWLGLVRPTITFALATAVGSLYVYTALVLTGAVTSAHETGLFAASFRVFIIVATVPGVLVTTAFPLLSRAARDDRDRLSYAVQRLFEGTALLGGAALVTCVLGAQPIMDVVAGLKFRGAVDVLRIQGVALALTFVIATWGFSLLALHRHRAMILANLGAMSVSATTVLVLAHAHGAVGAAVGTLLGETTLAIGYAIGLAKGDRRLRPQPGRLPRALPGLALALACAALPVAPAARTVAGLVVYGAGLLALGAIPDEVREHLPGGLGRRTPASGA